jgi:glycosyltransferase involved in cell wall biosynthesis
MISFVIPVFNEVESLSLLHDEIADHASRTGHDYEIIFIDDGSRDASWSLVKELRAANPKVRGIRFRRNFGKAAALSAGFEAARGEIIMTLDADLQDDPGEIPRFLEALAQDKDVVSGWKRRRHDPWHKVGPSRVFNGLVSWLTGVKLHDHNCGFKCYRAEVFQEVRLYGEMHRFIPVLAAARGFRVGEIEVNHRPRRFGHSKYGVKRFIKGFLDLLTVKFLTGFGQRPAHFLGSIGLISFLLGVFGLTYLAVTWFFTYFGWAAFQPLSQRPLVMYSLGALLLGAQMMTVGFLAELMTAYMTRETDHYSIAEKTDASEPSR